MNAKDFEKLIDSIAEPELVTWLTETYGLPERLKSMNDGSRSARLMQVMGCFMVYQMRTGAYGANPDKVSEAVLKELLKDRKPFFAYSVLTRYPSAKTGSFSTEMANWIATAWDLGSEALLECFEGTSDMEERNTSIVLTCFLLFLEISKRIPKLDEKTIMEKNSELKKVVEEKFDGLSEEFLAFTVFMRYCPKTFTA